MAAPRLYAIDSAGDLRWYLHLGRDDGSVQWLGPKKVGRGWGGFKHVLCGGDGVIYAVEPGGRLLWYRHLGRDDGSERWEGPKTVAATGWADYEHVFDGGGGVLYAVETRRAEQVHVTGGTTPASGGRLLWWRHRGRDDGTDRWDGPHPVGTGWNGFEHAWSPGDGIIYYIEPRGRATLPTDGRATAAYGGRLRWVRHLGHQDGSPSWSESTTAANGWSGLPQVCSGQGGVIYRIEPVVPAAVHAVGGTSPASGGTLRWYRHRGLEDGANRWDGPTQVGTGWGDVKALFAGRDSDPQIHQGRFCDFCDAPGTPQVGPRSYGLKGGPRAGRLTWSVTGKANGLDEKATEAALRSAFALWTRAVPALDFRQVERSADIAVVVGDLGGPKPGGFRLAETAGDGSVITLNDNAAVSFVASGSAGISLLAVAAHEIGHAIGILHSTTPGTVMYPFNSGVEVLGDEDMAAARALYGWAPQTSVSGIGPGTGASPALCVCGTHLVLAWKGPGADGRLWTSQSTDGIRWTPQRVVPGCASTDGPALAWDGAQLWLALRGGAGDDGLRWTVSRDLGANWDPPQTMPGTGSATAPSMTIFQGAPLLAWRGVQGDEGLYYTRWNAGWLPQQLIGGAGSSDRPSVCMDLDGRPRMVWRGVSGDDSLYTSTLVGQFWQPQQQISWVLAGNGAQGTVGIGIPASAVGPTLVNAGALLYMAWQGVVEDDAIYFTQAAAGPAGGIEWSSQAVIRGVGTSGRPALVAIDGAPFLAWKGIGTEATIYTTRQVRR